MIPQESTTTNTPFINQLSAKPIWLLMLIMSGVIALRWPVLFSDFQSYGGDTVRWAGSAINFSKHGFDALDYLPTTSHGFYDVEMGGRSRYLTWPFPPSYMLTGFVKLFGESPWALRLLPLLLNFCVAFYLLLLASKIFKHTGWGILGATFFLLLPAELYYSLQVCDTQFWLLGSIAGFYHLSLWMDLQRKVDFIACVFWLLFACASSWFGYLATMVALLFTFVNILQNSRQNWFKSTIKSPIPWLIFGSLCLVGLHIGILINALGVDKFSTLYLSKWQTYTGGHVVNAATPDADLWLSIKGAIRYRLGLIQKNTIGNHIVLFLSLPIALICGASFILLLTRTLLKLDTAIHKACAPVIVYFSSFYLIYFLIFPKHLVRWSHNFTTQMLVPVFVILLVYVAKWAWDKLDKQFISLPIKVLPAMSIVTLLAVMSINYLAEDPTLRPGGSRDRRIEWARLFGATLVQTTEASDLILSNHQGWQYDNKIMKFTARRTVKLKLYKPQEIKEIVEDEQFQSVVFIYRKQRSYERNNKAFSDLIAYLDSNAKEKYLIDNPEAYPGLTFYRLK